MSQRMKEQLAQIDEYSGADLFPISLLWLVNKKALDGNIDLTNKFIVALLSTGMTLYYINDDFDGIYPFDQFPLSNRCVENIPNMIASTYDNSYAIDSLNPEIARERPAWFSSTLSLEFEKTYEGQLYEINEDGLQVNIGALFVKCFDVMNACQLQGIGVFYWPRAYSSSDTVDSVKYSLTQRKWARGSPAVKINGSENDQSLSTLHRSRIVCLKRALLVHYGKVVNKNSGENGVDLPSVKVIYRLISSLPEFTKRNATGAEVISFSSFNQDWKTRYRKLILDYFSSKG